MNISQKKAVDILVPTVLAGVTVWFLFTRTKKVEYVIAGGVIVFALGYIVTSQLTKATLLNGPAPVPTGGGCDSYQPNALIDAIYEDTTCTFCTRDRALYDTLLGLSDCQIIKAYNYWNEKYYTQTNASLAVQIAKQGNFWDDLFGTQQTAIKLKFATLNLQ